MSKQGYEFLNGPSQGMLIKDNKITVVIKSDGTKCSNRQEAYDLLKSAGIYNEKEEILMIIGYFFKLVDNVFTKIETPSTAIIEIKNGSTFILYDKKVYCHNFDHSSKEQTIKGKHYNVTNKFAKYYGVDSSLHNPQSSVNIFKDKYMIIRNNNDFKVEPVPEMVQSGTAVTSIIPPSYIPQPPQPKPNFHINGSAPITNSSTEKLLVEFLRDISHRIKKHENEVQTSIHNLIRALEQTSMK